MAEANLKVNRKGMNAMNYRKTILLSLLVGVVGCASEPEQKTEKQLIGVGNVEFNSLYHYGYNSGCKARLLVTADTSREQLDENKDPTLDGLSQYDQGWQSGVESCQNGTFESMYTVVESEPQN